MLSATDTFIQYLSAGLAGNPAVHWIHADENDANANLPQVNALNVTVLRVQRSSSVEIALMSLDLMGTNERQLLGWLDTIMTLLTDRQVIPELQYEPDPANPTPVVGKAVSWDGLDVKFVAIPADTHYLHLNATFPISHAAL